MRLVVDGKLAAALWFDGRDIGDPAMVPMLVLPGGDVVRGLDALARMADLGGIPG